jgi:hypothetical protein
VQFNDVPVEAGEERVGASDEEKKFLMGIVTADRNTSGVAIDGTFMPNVHKFAFQSLIWRYDESPVFDVPLE